jgi:tight adherence protein B
VILLAALSVGACCSLLAGHVVGSPVDLGRWPRARAGLGPSELWLRQAGVGLRPYQFVLGSVAVGAVVLVVGMVATGAALVAVVPAVAVAWLPRAYFARRRAARQHETQASWPDGLRDLTAAITAGASLTQALTSVAETGPMALRTALRRFPQLVRLLGTVPALEVVKEELADPTSDRVIEVLILASERGGPIVRTILEDLVVATTKDLKVLDEIESEGLEMKINARVVLVMPWFVLVALTLRPGPFRDFYGSAAGLLVVLAGAAASALGSFWIGRLGRRQEEQRVFGGSSLGEVAA